ncbi:AAEL004789-PA [Aedes aegypti]|uniref:AAEL004789-PA n=1 Tax=Aedes aegypti TaxID=7159 RepID=Q17BV8_AEDAE|nr:AAEL004789-PA [Aedes aegypti]
MFFPLVFRCAYFNGFAIHSPVIDRLLKRNTSESPESAVIELRINYASEVYGISGPGNTNFGLRWNSMDYKNFRG